MSRHYELYESPTQVQHMTYSPEVKKELDELQRIAAEKKSAIKAEKEALKNKLREERIAAKAKKAEEALRVRVERFAKKEAAALARAHKKSAKEEAKKKRKRMLRLKRKIGKLKKPGRKKVVKPKKLGKPPTPITIREAWKKWKENPFNRPSQRLREAYFDWDARFSRVHPEHWDTSMTLPQLADYFYLSPYAIKDRMKKIPPLYTLPVDKEPRKDNTIRVRGYWTLRYIQRYLKEHSDAGHPTLTSEKSRAYHLARQSIKGFLSLPVEAQTGIIEDEETIVLPDTDVDL